MTNSLSARFCRFISAKADAKCAQLILAGDLATYHQLARVSDKWWKLGGGQGR